MKEIETEHGIFTELTDREGNVVKTAEEYYEWWLQNKDITTSEPTEIEILKKENELLKTQVETLSATTSFHEELIVEMAMKVYA